VASLKKKNSRLLQLVSWSNTLAIALMVLHNGMQG
jgi:hypothetical protein